jgi:hypothetical protein
MSDKSGTIGWAVKELHNGERVCRKGWNAIGMWIELQEPDDNSKISLPYVYMMTAQGQTIPWNCSQADLLATDWVLAE